jgi:hypothetical protein
MTTPDAAVIPWPERPVSDDYFLTAIEGYVRCLDTDQEARLSRIELERLASMARQARTNTRERVPP